MKFKFFRLRCNPYIIDDEFTIMALLKFEADIKRFSNKTRILNQNMFFLVFLSS